MGPNRCQALAAPGSPVRPPGRLPILVDFANAAVKERRHDREANRHRGLDHRPAPLHAPALTQTSQLVVGVAEAPACKDQASVLKLVSEKDKAAFDHALEAAVQSGECTILQRDQDVIVTGYMLIKIDPGSAGRVFQGSTGPPNARWRRLHADHPSDDPW